MTRGAVIRDNNTGSRATDLRPHLTLRPEYSLGHSALNAFLFASIGDEKSGVALTVLSALARLGIDPWTEAARLSALPKEASIAALAALIARLPEGDWQASDARTIALRLVEILPQQPTSVLQPAVSASLGNGLAKSASPMWLLGILLLVVAVLGYWNFYSDQAAQPAPISASPH
jgi:hypothetical protein